VSFLRAVGSGNIDVSAVLTKNGSVNSTSKVIGTTNHTNKHSLCIPYTIEMAQNDYLEVYVANETGTDNITVTGAIFKASR
jgi:hypothetical protein